MRVIRIARPDWFADAACLGIGPAEFFPRQGQNTAAARQRCAQCPAALQCLEYALADPSLEGIWGGTTDGQRDRIRRKRAKNDPNSDSWS